MHIVCSIPGSPNGDLDKRDSEMLEDELTDSFYGVRTSTRELFVSQKISRFAHDSKTFTGTWLFHVLSYAELLRHIA